MKAVGLLHKISSITEVQLKNIIIIPHFLVLVYRSFIWIFVLLLQLRTRMGIGSFVKKSLLLLHDLL